MKTLERSSLSNGHESSGHDSNGRGSMRIPMLQEPEQAPVREPLRDFLRILFQYRWRGMLLFCLSLSLVTAGLVFWPRKYSSDAKLLVRVGRSSVTLDPTVTTGQTLGLETRRENEINSALEILNGRGVLEKLLDAVGAEKPINTPLERERAIIQLSEDLETWSPKRTDVIGIAYEAQSPERAQAVVSELVEIFLAEHMRVNRTPRSLQFFEEQASQLKAQLDEATESLRKAKEKFALTSIEGRRATLEKQIQDIEHNTIDTETGLSSSQARSAAWESAMRKLPVHVVRQFVQGLPADAANSMREQLFILQSREKELAVKLTDSHPTLIAAREQVRMLEELLAAEQPDQDQAISAVVVAERVVEEGLAARRKTIDARRTSLGDELAALNAQEVQIVDLTREVELLDTKYRTYVQSMEQARIDQELDRQQITNISVIQPPSFIAKPSSPKKAVTLLAGFVVSAIGALSLVVISDQLSSSFKSVAEVESSLGQPVLATLPKNHRGMRGLRRRIKTLQRDDRPPALASNDASSEDFHAFLSSCHWSASSADQPPPQTIGFASSCSQEGASSLAVNCAAAAASTGRQVLLVDDNWVRPALHETFTVSQSPGLAEFMRGDEVLLEIQSTGIPNLSLLAAGSASASLSSAQGSPERLQALLESVTQRFDLVIFDVPPIGNSEVALPLLSRLDGVVLVMELNRVPKDTAHRAVLRLQRAGARLLGIAVNKYVQYVPRWLPRAAT